MPMLHVYPSPFSAAKITPRMRSQADRPMRSRRQRRARITAGLNAAAIVLALAGIGLICIFA